MIRFLLKTFRFIFCILIFLVSIAVYLLATTAGLHTIIQLSSLYLPGTIQVKDVAGSLLYHFTIGELEYQNDTLKVNAKQLSIRWNPHFLQGSQSLNAQWDNLQLENEKNKVLNSPKGTLTAMGVLPNLEINLNSQITTIPKDHWSMNAKIRGTLPWRWSFDANLSQAQSESTKRVGLYTNLSTKGKITAKNQGNFLLTISPGFYHIPTNDFMPILKFNGGSLTAILSPEKLTGSGRFAIDENKNLKLEFQLPKFALDTGLTDKQPINSNLSLELSSLDFLQNISPEINKLKGQLLASITVKGTLSKNQITSQLLLSKASLFLPKLGLDLDNIELNVHGKEKSWGATGLIASAGHHLSLTGKGTLSDQLTGEFLLEGADFPLVKTNEYQVHISPKLNLRLTPTIQSLSGTILIPYAEIKPQTFGNSISLPEDIVYKHQEKSSSPSTFINSMDINLEMGQEVTINMKGLKGHLDGTLQAKQVPQGSINANGELSVREGTYKAYGQNLTIQKGQLVFTGGPIDNPGINVRATKKISTSSNLSGSNNLFNFSNGTSENFNYGETMTLGVEVSGRLTHPKIQLFSDPSVLSQADILSMLVLGRPANQANKAGGQLLLTAISSMNLGGNGGNNFRLLEQLKQTTGIDFNMQTNTNYNQVTNTANDSTSVVVGKSLSKRLYLSYNIGLSQTDTNMLMLRYLLNKFFSIQVSSSSTSNAIDFLYTSNKKSKPHKD